MKNLIVWGLRLSKETVFFGSNIIGGGDGRRFLKSVCEIPLI